MGNVLGTSQQVIRPDYSEYIGRGSFGFVYRGMYGGQAVAVKTINRHMLKDSYTDIDANEIVPLVRGLRHPNVIAVLAWEDKGHEIWLALELCTLGLDVHLKEHEPVAEQTASLARQMARGLAYLHTHHIIHRDVKPDNFLVMVHPEAQPVVKVTDFSLCKDMAGASGSTMNTVRGNRDWLAPELFTDAGRRAKNASYKRSIDVFSLGLVVLYLCVNKAAREQFTDASYGAHVRLGGEVCQHFEEHWRSPYLKRSMLPLLCRMLQLDPNARPAMMEVACTFGPDMISSFSHLEHIASHYLEVEASSKVGFGGPNLALLGFEDSNAMHLLKLTDGQYCSLWRKQCPPDVKYLNEKLLMSNMIVTKARQYSPTICCDTDFNLLHQHNIGRSSLKLVASCPPHTLVYSGRTSIGGHQLAVYDGDSAVRYLRAPVINQWSSERVSACIHPTSEWVATTESRDESLHIFDITSGTCKVIDLKYSPGVWNAITCTDSNLYIAEFRCSVVHVYTWSGDKVATVDLRQLVKIAEGEGVLWGLHVCNGNVLHAACGNWNVTSLHAFTIKVNP